MWSLVEEVRVASSSHGALVLFLQQRQDKRLEKKKKKDKEKKKEKKLFNWTKVEDYYCS